MPGSVVPLAMFDPIMGKSKKYLAVWFNISSKMPKHKFMNPPPPII